MYEGPVGISPPVANLRLLIPLLSPWLTSLQSVSTQNKFLYIYFKAPHHTAPEGYMVGKCAGLSGDSIHGYCTQDRKPGEEGQPLSLKIGHGMGDDAANASCRK